MRSMKVHLQSIIWALILLVLIFPSGLTAVTNSGVLHHVIDIPVAIIALLMFFKRPKVSQSGFFYIVYFLWICLITAFTKSHNRDDILGCYNNALINIAIILFLNYTIRMNAKRILSILFWEYSILVSANLLLMIVAPNGLYSTDQMELYGRGYWLFGHVNSTITYELPLLYVAFAYLQCDIKKGIATFAKVMIFTSIFSVIYSKSATATVGIAIFVIVMLCMKLKILERFFTIKTALIFGTLMSLAVVFMGIQTFFSGLIENVLKRSLTFTGRVFIWERTLGLLQRHWLFGMGYHQGTNWVQLIRGASAHNEYLYVLIQGGIFLLVVFYAIFLSMNQSIRTRPNHMLSKVTVALVFCLFVMFMMETHMHRMAVLITLMGCTSLFQNQMDMK